MAYTITFENEPTKIVYMAGSPVEYLVKVAYGGGDPEPATMILTFAMVQGGATYNETVTKTVQYFNGTEAYFYFNIFEIVKKYVYPELTFDDLADSNARNADTMDCYITSINFQLYVEDTSGLIVVEGSPVNPAATTLGFIRGLFQDNDTTRDILDYLFVGTGGMTALQPLTTRPAGGYIGGNEWDVFSIAIVGDVLASGRPVNGYMVSAVYASGLTSNTNVALTLPNNTAIKDKLYYIIPSGTANLGAAGFPLGLSGLASYTVTLGNCAAFPVGTFIAKYESVSRTVTNCVPETKVIFFNSLGGIDCFNFYKSREDVFHSESETFTKQQPAFFYDNISVATTGTEKTKAFSKRQTKLETFCTQEEYEWLATELLTSTKVYIMISDFGLDTQIYPVTVVSAEATAYNLDTGELYANFEFQYSNPQKGL